MTDIDIDAIRTDKIRKITDAASIGPWAVTRDGLVWAPRAGDPVSGSTEIADAEFIAAARTLMPALCDGVEQLRAALAQSREQAATAAKRIDGLRDYILGALDEDEPLTTEEMRNASIDLADVLADLGHPVPDENEDEAPRRPVATVELPAEAVAR